MNKVVTCPTCKKVLEYSDGNPWRPFCSERCQTLDLGRWASEKYAIAGEEKTSDTEVNENPQDDEEPEQIPPRHLMI